MPSSLRTRIRGSRAGSPATPLEYAMLALAAVVLVGLVFFALGGLVDNQMACENHAQSTAAAARC
jgi:hypothetical protein